MYNIKKAVSRLDFAPRIDEITITDIKSGIGSFTPKPNKPVSFVLLKAALKKAGYNLASADLTVVGVLLRDDVGWWIENDSVRQRFALKGNLLDQALKGLETGNRIEVSGNWQTEKKEATSFEVIEVRSASRVPEKKTPHEEISANNPTVPIQVSLSGIGNGLGLIPASVRATSPGLTVYRGGAITPRYFFVRQHLNGLEVTRSLLRLGVSYTPTSTIQVEAEIPYSATSFDDGVKSGSENGFGNVIVWGKYRFYRSLETWGDRQAALRIGAELPSGSTDSPGADKVSAPEFVRQQLSPIEGGFAFHTDISYSQAHHRYIFGGNIESTVRDDRNGFHSGNQIKVNTDLEYVLLPLQYQNPGKELFVILETTYSYRGRGRIGGRVVPGSSSSEFYLAPALQFTASPRLVLEASYQFPVVINAGPVVLRTDRNVLVGLRYLY